MDAKKVLTLKKGDVILVLFVLAFVGICLLYLAATPEGSQVEVTVQGKTTVYPMSENQRILIEQKGHRTNVLVIENREAYMEWADCPDQICVRHKPIQKDGESIICLPQEVYIAIIGGEHRGYDN